MTTQPIKPEKFFKLDPNETYKIVFIDAETESMAESQSIYDPNNETEKPEMNSDERHHFNALKYSLIVFAAKILKWSREQKLNIRRIKASDYTSNDDSDHNRYAIQHRGLLITINDDIDVELKERIRNFIVKAVALEKRIEHGYSHFKNATHEMVSLGLNRAIGPQHDYPRLRILKNRFYKTAAAGKAVSWDLNKLTSLCPICPTTMKKP